MKIGLITTLNTNIGDDFIREGLCTVLKQLWGDSDLQLVPVNKHHPLSLYPDNHPLVRMRRLAVGGYRRQLAIRQLSRVFRRVGSTRFDDCDAIVQCGAPVYWLHCGKETAWRQDLWHDVVGRLYRRIPVFNLAAGSCFPVKRQPETFEDPEDRKYVRWLHHVCRATTVRDPLALKLLASLGCDAELIRCSAFLFTSPAEAAPREDGPVLFNYMDGGGHYDWGQNVDKNRWERTAQQAVATLRKTHRVAMLCHNEKEKSCAEISFPGIECLLPSSFREFPAMVRHAKAAICNRMHASVALAGMGIPAVTVGTDTRLLMVEQLGLPCYFAEEVDAATLVADVERLIRDRKSIADELAVRREETRAAYERVLRQHFNPAEAPRSSRSRLAKSHAE